MEFDKLFRYPFVCPAAEAAGSCCEARLRRLHWAIPDYFEDQPKRRQLSLRLWSGWRWFRQAQPALLCLSKPTPILGVSNIWLIFL